MTEEEKNIRLDLAYDGTHYHGWQRQENAVTIQALVEDKIGLMTREAARLIASGRTDAGVHALNQVCHFKTRTDMDPESLRKGLNALLPEDIHVKKAMYAPPDFHARYSAKSKVYEYRVCNRKEPDIFQRHFCWHITGDLDLGAMNECLRMLIGKHDFSAFRSTGSGNRNPVRTMIRADIQNAGKGRVHMVFEADGFLRHMVRNIVGTVVDVGLGKNDSNHFKAVFHSGDRQTAGVKAPARGLFLTQVKY